jgi:hypothetical protein
VTRSHALPEPPSTDDAEAFAAWEEEIARLFASSPEFAASTNMKHTLDDRLADLMNWSDLVLGGPRPRSGEVAANVSLVLKEWELESLEPTVADAHQIYVDGLRQGTGGREGMIAALNITLMLLNRGSEGSLRFLMEPLAVLAGALRELGEGATHPALELRSRRKGRPAASPRSRKREFISRCVWAADACEETGANQPSEQVFKAAKTAAKQFFSGATYKFSPEMVERWRKTYAKEARERMAANIDLVLGLPHSFAPFVRDVLLAGLEPHNLDRSFDTIAYELGLRVEPAKQDCSPTPANTD